MIMTDRRALVNGMERIIWKPPDLTCLLTLSNKENITDLTSNYIPRLITSPRTKQNNFECNKITKVLYSDPAM